jgi:hypothetical protein
MQWPFDRRAEPTHAWGAITVGTAGLVGLPVVQATLHANE